MPRPADTVLEVENLTVNGKHGTAVNKVSFSVRAGEIVGIAGIEGNGQTELIEALSGLMKPAEGAIEFEGRDVTGASARRLKEMGIAHIPEDRHKRGLLLNSDLAENSILGVHYRPPAASASGLMNSSRHSDARPRDHREFRRAPAESRPFR